MSPALVTTIAGPGHYVHVAWITESMLVVRDHAEEGEIPRYLLTGLEMPSGDFSELSLPTPEDCTPAAFGSPERVGAAGLAYWVSCTELVTDFGQPHSLYAGEPATKSELVAILDFAPAQIAWSPIRSSGMVDRTSRVCAALYWLIDGSAVPVEVDVGSGSQRFTVGGVGTGADCQDTGRAELPTWSADGNQIAFFASPESVGISGANRLAVPWNMYVMDADALEPEEILSGVVDPLTLEWSPDGATLLFRGEMPGHSELVWTLSVEDRVLAPVTGEPYFHPTWSPDGESIAAIRSPSGLVEADSDIVVIARSHQD
jgi:hypothetical protein